jgi:hypothetical protein
MAVVIDSARNARYVQPKLKANYVEIQLCKEFEELLRAKPYVSSKFRGLLTKFLETKKGKAFAQMSVKKTERQRRP